MFGARKNITGFIYSSKIIMDKKNICYRNGYKILFSAVYEKWQVWANKICLEEFCDFSDAEKFAKTTKYFY